MKTTRPVSSDQADWAKSSLTVRTLTDGKVQAAWLELNKNLRVFKGTESRGDEGSYLNGGSETVLRNVSDSAYSLMLLDWEDAKYPMSFLRFILAKLNEVNHFEPGPGYELLDFQQEALDSLIKTITNILKENENG